MADQWVQIELEGVIPEAIKQLASKASIAVDAVKTVLNVQIAALKFVAALTVDLLDVEAAVAKATVEVIETALEDLTGGDVALKVLVVPFRKQPNYRLDPTNWPIAATDSDQATLIDEEAAAKERKLNEQLRRAAFYDGGNHGFLRSVADSIFDQDDPNRPTDGDDVAMFAHVWMVGASDILGILDALLTLEGLFGISLKGKSFVPRTINRTPQDLRLKPIVAPSGKVGVMLEWKNPPAEQLHPEFSELRMRLHEVAVIRSTDDEVMKAKNWTDIFGDQQPGVFTDDDDSDRELKDVLSSSNSLSTAILQYRYDGDRDSYLDDSDLQRDTDYYYAVAYRYAIELPEGVSGISNATIVDGFYVTDYKLLSSVQSVRFAKEIAESGGGIQPDWITSPNLLSMIPDLQFYVLVLQDYVKSIADKLTGTNSALLAYIQFLESEITRYEQLVSKISNRIQKLLGLLKTPEAGIYTTSIALGSGGSVEFVRELAQRLFDEEDESKPPFTTGTEFVAGLVFLAEAPNLSQLEPVRTLIDLLFGIPESIKSSFEEALDSLEEVIDSVTADDDDDTLGDDLQPGTPAATVEGPQKTFNDALEPVDADDADANVPFDP